MKKALCSLLIVSLFVSQTSALCNELKQKESNQDKRNESLGDKVGKLKYNKGIITGEAGTRYYLSRKTSGINARSIYEIDTISDEKLDKIINQHRKNEKSLENMGKVAGVFVGLSLLLVGTGLTMVLVGDSQDDPNVPNKIEEKAEKEVGKDIAKLGGLGFWAHL